MEETEVEEIKISLEDAIGMALENNPRIKAADASIRSAQLSVQVAEEAGKEYKDMEKMMSKIPASIKGMGMTINVSEGLEQAYLKHGYYVDAAKVGLELSEISKEQVTAAISYEVTEKYYNVKLMEALVGISETGAKLAEDNLAMLESQYEAGYVSRLDVRNAENAVLGAKNSLESYKRNLDLAKRSFKLSLQIEAFTGDVILTDEVKMPDMPENVEIMIEGALKSRYDMTALTKDYELKMKMFDITKLYMSDKTAKYYSAYSEFLNSEYTYNNTLKLMSIGLESEYAAILGAAEKVAVCERDLEVKKDIYESRKTMYELGLITNLELTSALADFDSSRVQLENARVTYALSVIKFGYNTTIGI